MSQTVKVGLGVFADYVNAVGAERIKIIEQQVERITDPTRLAWMPYQRAERGIKAAIGSVDPGPALQRMVEEAPTNWQGHYQEIADGARLFLSRHRVTRVPVRTATCSLNELTVSVGHHVGLRNNDGRIECCFLYLKQAQLTPSTANAITRMLELAMDAVLPGASAAVLDVRRGKLYRARARRNVERFDAWLHAEARGYFTHWRGRAA